MYTRAQKESSSTSPTFSIHKKSNNCESSHSFSVQRQPEINSSQEKERPRYSRKAADLLAANVMRSMEARQQGEEAQGAASVTEVVMPKPKLPIAPVASVFQPLREMGIGRQCSACEQGMEFGKDSDEMSSVAGVQTKLTVGAVGDRYEQEADRVAAQVMRMSVAPDNSPQVRRFGEEDNPVQMWSLAQSITPVVHRQVDEQVQMQALVQRAFQAGGNQASGDLESRLNASKGGGSALAPEVRAFMEPRFGADFSSVRVHTGSEAVQMNRELGAQAFAHGSDVYFGAGKSPGNNELTAHELTHVVQQTGAVHHKMIQRAISPTHDLTNGTFDVKATPQDATSGGPNVPITIKFTPKTTAPISNQIGLIQIVKLTNSTGGAVEPQSLPAARGASLRTQTTDGTGVGAGYFTDVLHNPTATGSLPAGGANQGDPLAPQYVFGNGPAQPNPATPGLSRPDSKGLSGAIMGFKRSDDPADIKAAEITDAPGGNGEFDFAFETVAKGEDTNTIYGAMKWSFQIRGGKIQGDTSSAVESQSATFDAALERHRDFYVHEPVIFYFDFDRDTLSPTEIAKIATFKAYLARFATPTPTNPKIVRVSPEGLADQRGNAAYNRDLSRRRAEFVKNALLAEGIPAAQIGPVTVGGATADFTSDATTDQDRDANRQFNRRVVLVFKQETP